jgi:hypothetical protein
MAAVVTALALGCLVGALLPLGRSVVHPLATALLAVALAGAVALFTRWYGGRLVKQLGIEPPG